MPLTADSTSAGTRIDLDLSTEDREELGRLLRQMVDAGLAGVADLHDDVLKGRDQYDAVKKRKDWPWPNASNLNVPITRSIVDTIHARALRVMRGSSPYFKVTPYKGADVPAAQRIEDLLEWQMQTEVGLAEKLDTMTTLALRDGNAIGFVPWKREVRKHRDRLPLDAELRAEIAADPDGATEVDLLPDGQMVELEIEEVVKNGPDLELIDVRNYVMYPHNAPTIKDASLVGHRYWETAFGLRQGVLDGLYDEDAIDDLLEEAFGSEADSLNEQKGADPDRLEDGGLSTYQEYARDEDKPFELFHLIVSYDHDGDGLAEDILVCLEYERGRVLSAIEYPYWHGRRCYVNYCPYPKPGMFYGYRLPQILEDLAAEINAIRNQRVDAGTLGLMPMLVARRGARYEPNKNKWRPGGVLWLDTTDDVKPLTFSASTQAAFAEEASAREMSERVSGASDYSQGQSPSRSRTLGEIQQVLAEGNLKFDVVIQRLQAANNEFAGQVLGLNRQYLDAETEYQITRAGDEEPIFATISKKDIARRVGVRAHGNTLNSNAELELAAAEKLYMMSERNPLMTRPTRIFEVTKNYLVKMGLKHVTPFIGTLEEAQQMEQAQAEAPPPGPEPTLSGKLGELVSMALLLQSQPEIAQELVKASELLGQIQARQAMNEFAVSRGQQEVLRQDEAAAAQSQPSEIERILTEIGA